MTRRSVIVARHVSLRLHGARRLTLLAVSLFAFEVSAHDFDEAQFAPLESEARARIQNLNQHLHDWNIEGAREELSAVAQIVQEDSKALAYYGGRIAFEEGRYGDAVALLTKAGVEDVAGSWLRLAKDTQALIGTFERAESAHFMLLYPQGRDAVLVPWALEALERMREALSQDLGYAPPAKIRIEVVSTAAELSKISTLSRQAIKTTGTIAICKFSKLMVTSPKAVLHGYDWLDTLAHEYTHLVISRMSHNTVPIWMHEGIAKYLESRWHGPAGASMTPSTLALLGSRVRSKKLIPFEKMQPSIALLPTAQDAVTAFAEVFHAIQLIHQSGSKQPLRRLLLAMATGVSDREAVARVMKKPWADFEKAWLASLEKLPYPREFIPPSSNEKKQLLERKKREREVSFSDFVEVSELEARRNAHLGELLRERRRMVAAAEVFQRALKQVGNRYESISNKYALTLLELERYDEAAKVLEASLGKHPGSADSNVHLGRIRLREEAWGKAKTAYLAALAVNPFNPEVHAALWFVGKSQQDVELQKRAAKGLVALLAIPISEVPKVALQLARLRNTGAGQ